MEPSFLSFVRAVSGHLVRSRRLSRAQLENVRNWWMESRDCCPEAIAADVESVYPTTEQIHNFATP